MTDDELDDLQKGYLEAKAEVLFELWRAKFEREILPEFKVLATEDEFVFPLLNPETEAPSRTFNEAGMRDVIFEERATGHIWLGEHKTSSEDITPGSDYWERLRMDNQVSKYELSLHAKFPDRVIGGTVYDVVQKFRQKGLSIAEKDGDGFKIVLDPAGNRVFNKNGKPRQTEDKEQGWEFVRRPETNEELSNRLLESVSGRVDEWVRFERICRGEDRLVPYMVDAWMTTKEILYRRKSNVWPKNPDACMSYGRKCEYWNLCVGGASIDGVRYRERENKHPELTVAPGVSDKELLTNSRMKCLRLCPERHRLKYEVGVEKVGEESEALWFGSLWHEKLETYLEMIKGE